MDEYIFQPNIRWLRINANDALGNHPSAFNHYQPGWLIVLQILTPTGKNEFKWKDIPIVDYIKE